MSATRDAQRIDALLATALLFGQSLAVRREEAEEQEETPRIERALALLSGLGAAEKLAAQSRADWFARLAPQKQREWLAHVLGGARRRTPDAARLDEHVHPSHIVAALEAEPPLVRAHIISQLPQPLARTVAREFAARDASEQDSSQSLSNARARARGAEPAGGRARWAEPAAEPAAHSPAPEVIAVVRRAFLSNFTEASALTSPKALDFLSGVELARLVRLLGVRETAVACRGIASREAMAAFLRRFVAEDARAITAHLRTLALVEPRRIEFAGEVLHEALSAEPEMGAMLDRVGLRLLAFAFAGRDRAPLRYTAQKLPRAAAHLLRQFVEGGVPSAATDDGREVARAIATEAEGLAAEMRRRAGRQSAE